MKHVIYWLQRENMNKPVPLKACSRFERIFFLCAIIFYSTMFPICLVVIL